MRQGPPGAAQRKAKQLAAQFQEFCASLETSASNFDIFYSLLAAIVQHRWIFPAAKSWLLSRFAPKPDEAAIAAEASFPIKDLNVLVPLGGAAWDCKEELPALLLTSLPEWMHHELASKHTRRAQAEVLQAYISRAVTFEATGNEEAKEEAKGFLKYVRGLITYHHQRSPEYLVEKASAPLEPARLLRQDSLGAVVAPSAALRSAVAESDDQTREAFWEANARLSVQFVVQCQLLSLFRLAFLTAALVCVKLTPTVRDDECLSLDTIDDYALMAPPLAKLFSFWPLLTATAYIAAFWPSMRALAKAASQDLHGKLNLRYREPPWLIQAQEMFRLLPQSAMGNALMAQPNPAWPSFWSIVHSKLAMGFLAGVVEELEYRLIRPSTDRRTQR